MKKFEIFIALLLVASMMLAACAPKASAPAPEAPAAVAEAPAADAPAAEAPVAQDFSGQTLNFLTIQPHNVAAQNLADWFTEETGATVNLIVVPYDNVIEKAVLDVTSGAGEVDVVDYWYPGLGALVENGVLVNLDEWWAANEAKLDFDDYFADYRDLFTLIDGSRWGIPFDGDMHILYYNKVLFEKYGFEPPATWDEYLEICKTITEGELGNDVYGCAIMGAKSPLILIGSFLNRTGFGGTLFDADGNPTVNSPENVMALQAMLDQAEYALPTPSATAFDEALGGWFTGKVGMVEFWTDLGSMTDAPDTSVIPGQWGAVALPKGSGEKGRVVAPVNAGFGMGVSAASKNPDLAFAFLEFVSRPDIAKRYNTVVGGIDPVRKSTLADPDYIAFAGEEIVAAISSAHEGQLAPWPTNSLWFKLQESLTDNLSLALTGDKSAQKALDDTQATWEKIIADNQ